MAVVTIARQLGSGGEEIARAVARELHVPYYDKEVIALAAARLGITEEMAASEMAERPLVNRLISLLLLRTPPGAPVASDEPASAMDVKRITSTGYRLTLEEVIRELAATGRAVIVGQASQVILQSTPHVIHVFITAPLTDRIDRVMRERGVGRAEAQRLIEASDQERSGYLMAEYGTTWQSPYLYSLVINTGRCSTATAVAAIVAAARAADLLRGPSEDTTSRRLRQEVYTVAEAADLLMMNPEVIRHAIYGGELPADRVGKNLLLIHRSDLIEWLERRAAPVQS
jgi:excisionase family DNA binding protein